uniref:Uncharacterized protein LOC104210334 n=1 Tax=Nicotiana sylvestris TaxID=4096 RepID=A0A1U7V700_NICSY|nr:PREDICTED: uncharacterized protein LOC104210334 [Nicotiana sylvestris]
MDSNWCEQIKFHLEVLDLDVTLYTERPTAITETSSAEERSYFKHRNRSNRLSLMFMRMNIAGNIKTTLPKTESAKDFLKLVEECSQTADKSLAGTLMGNLTTMKFDGSRIMHEHVIEMTNIAVRLKTLGMEVDDNFIVQFIINSLLSEYGPFQMNYNTMKDKWNVHELHGILVQEETRLKNQGTHSINLVGHQGVGKKGKKHEKVKQMQHNVNESSSQVRKKEHKNDKCRFYRKPGHFQKYCLKCKAWFEKKGIPYNPAINQNERFVYMGIRVKAPVEAIGTYHLILDIWHHLDLFETFYVPSFSRNLFSLSKLDKAGYFLKFSQWIFQFV